MTAATKAACDFKAGDSTPFWTATADAITKDDIAYIETATGVKELAMDRQLPLAPTVVPLRARLLSMIGGNSGPSGPNGNSMMLLALDKLSDLELSQLAHYIRLDTSGSNRTFEDSIHAVPVDDGNRRGTIKQYVPLTDKQKRQRKYARLKQQQVDSRIAVYKAQKELTA